MKTRLISSAALAVALLASGAVIAADRTSANTRDSKQAESAQPTTAQGQKTVHAMFAFADQNKDSRLTRAEAKGHLPITSMAFDRIDTDKRGWISFDQFMAFTDKRVAKQADDIQKIGASQ